MDNPTTNYTFSDFPVGAKVQVASKMVDFTAWDGEDGTVIGNSGRYLGISVSFPKLAGRTWNFNPENLKPYISPEEERVAKQREADMKKYDIPATRLRLEYVEGGRRSFPDFKKRVQQFANKHKVGIDDVSVASDGDELEITCYTPNEASYIDELIRQAKMREKKEEDRERATYERLRKRFEKTPPMVEDEVIGEE